VRKDLIMNIQKMIHDRTMFIPLTSTIHRPPSVPGEGKSVADSAADLVHGPFEDMELVK